LETKRKRMTTPLTPSSNNNNNNGGVVFKLAYQDEMRRLTVDGNTSFNQLVQTTSQMFFEGFVPLQFRWIDEDNDTITIATDEDLHEAIEFAKRSSTYSLRLAVSRVQKPKEDFEMEATPIPASSSSASASNVRQEVPSILSLLSHDVNYPSIEESVLNNQSQPPRSASSSSTSTQSEPQQPQTPPFSGHHGFGRHGHHRRYFHQHQQQQQQQQQNLPVDEQGRPQHVGVTCDGCQRPIFGIRYKCTECFDFDLCEDCEALQFHPAEHALLKIRLPTRVQLWRPYEFPQRHGRRWGGGGGCPAFQPGYQPGFGYPMQNDFSGFGFPGTQTQIQTQTPEGGEQSHWRGNRCGRFRNAQSAAANTENNDNENVQVPSPNQTPSTPTQTASTPVRNQTPVPDQTATATSEYVAQLSLLTEMGFFDTETNLRLLKERRGRLEEVITKLTEMML